ncbi:MAG: hypothetical protein GY925_03300 [Actinomycetia bacterium]|nr:hypothetical protein [Actinomycetes bacterium]
MKYVVTAPGRSGTKYVAALLTNAGLNCGHEQVFNSWGSNGRTIPAGWQSAPFDGDSSYVAAPFLPDIDPTIVVQLVRSPLDHIRSIVGIGHVSDIKQPWVGFLNIHAKLDEFPPGPARAAAYWVRWHEIIEPYADFLWKLHEIDTRDIADLADAIWLPWDMGSLDDAVATTDRTINARERADWVGLDDLGPMRQQVIETAERYGVPLETVPPVANYPETTTSNPTPSSNRAVVIEPGKGGWYRLLDAAGNELDKVRGKDRAEVRVRELMEETDAG